MRQDINVTNNIRAIETLKLELLKAAVGVIASLAETGQAQQERLESLADTLMNAYILAAKLGISFPELDARVCEALRLHIARQEDSATQASLLRHLRSR